VTPEPADPHGVVTLPSLWGLAETLARLRSAFAARGLKLFADLDQQAEARAAGAVQPPMHLLLAGNPRAGAPVMAAVPTAGLDLPLKVLVWEAAPGQVRVSFNSTDYLAARHGLAPELAQKLRGFEAVVTGALAG
jgi:uncharacterized protein (DUF302 family)